MRPVLLALSLIAALSLTALAQVPMPLGTWMAFGPHGAPRLTCFLLDGSGGRLTTGGGDPLTC